MRYFHSSIFELMSSSERNTEKTTVVQGHLIDKFSTRETVSILTQQHTLFTHERHHTFEASKTCNPNVEMRT